MATKKVEDKKVTTKKSSNKDEKKLSTKAVKKDDQKHSQAKKTTVKNEKRQESEKTLKEEKIENKKILYDVDEDDDFEEYDDEEELEEKEKKQPKEKTDKSSKEEKKVDDSPKTKTEKPKKKKRNSVTGDTFFEQNSDIFNLIKILIAVIIVIGVVYFVVAIINGEFKKEPKEDEEVVGTIQNEKILVSSIFDKEDKEFYVLAYDSTGPWADYFSMIYADYSSLENALPLFWVDLSDKLNSDVVIKDDEESNIYAQKASELRMKDPTLIYMKDGINYKYYDGDEVKTTLLDIIKKYKEEQED